MTTPTPTGTWTTIHRIVAPEPPGPARRAVLRAAGAFTCGSALLLPAATILSPRIRQTLGPIFEETGAAMPLALGALGALLILTSLEQPRLRKPAGLALTVVVIALIVAATVALVIAALAGGGVGFSWGSDDDSDGDSDADDGDNDGPRTVGWLARALSHLDLGGQYTAGNQQSDPQLCPGCGRLAGAGTGGTCPGCRW